MVQKKLKANGLSTKKEVQQALLELVSPLEVHFESSVFGLKFDSGGTVYEERTREIEAVLRPLWGIIPFLAGGGAYDQMDQYLRQIKKGTNPSDPAYWGRIFDRDQRMVEMAVLGVGLCLVKEQLWDRLTTQEQENLYNWLKQINDYEMPQNNWLFFRILVNLGLKNCKLPFNKERMKEDLAAINSYYLSNGWYVDGQPNQMDYYVPFAIHFYSLIYIKVVGAEDEVYVPLFKERAVAFAQSFRTFFAKTGEAVPFGRSMTYRFAQSAFWGALAFADIEALPWGEMKHLCLQNLRHWFKQDIFSAHGELTIGYYYRNLVMAEGYNGFGSPYWALKSFIFLALPEDHPFWLASETVGEIPKELVIPEARAILARDEAGQQVQMFTVGQNSEKVHAHSEAKYEKFVYSSSFGFSVSKGMIGLGQGAFDNTLAVSEQDDYYRVRHGVESYGIEEGYLYTVWKPWKDVKILTYIIPLMPWHVRIHFVETGRSLTLADGGFAINTEGERTILQTETEVAYCVDDEMSGIVNLLGDQKSELIMAEPNTNTHSPKTVIPTLKFECEPGNYVLASAVLGAVSGDREQLWREERPQIETSNDHDLLVITKGEQKISLVKPG